MPPSLSSGARTTAGTGFRRIPALAGWTGAKSPRWAGGGVWLLPSDEYQPAGSSVRQSGWPVRTPTSTFQVDSMGMARQRSSETSQT